MFGGIYQTKHFLVRAGYARRATLTYSSQRREYVLGSEKLPYVWAYDNAGNVESVFKVSDFRPLRMEYFPKEGRLHKRFEEDYSTLGILGPLEGRFVCPFIRHHSQKSNDVHSERVDYYVIDLKTNETYLLGTDTYGKDTVSRLFLATDEHQLLIIENGQVGIVR